MTEVDVYIEGLLQKIDDLTFQNKQLRRANTNVKAELRFYRRSYDKILKENRQNKPPPYKNSRRYR